MTQITITVSGLDTTARALRRAADKIAQSEPLMRDIGESVLTSTRHRFQTAIGPDGKRWKPSKRAIRQGGQTLVDTGRLRDSITLRASAREVTVGTNLVYAGVHQFGGKSRPMPARPYLGIDTADRAEIAEIVRGHVMRALGL